MAKKSKASAKSDDKQLAEAVRASAQQIWQAGLGAFAKAQDEGGKTFAKLVKDGTELQKRTQKLANGKAAEATDTVSKMAGNISKQASGSWDKLEHIFEERVSRSLKSLGIPTQRDIKDLSARVEELSKAVAVLSGKNAAAAKTSATKPAAKSPAKKATAKPAAKKVIGTAAKKATNK
jgi:poly(hydroxyalkanoate) granule-associated protein